MIDLYAKQNLAIKPGQLWKGVRIATDGSYCDVLRLVVDVPYPIDSDRTLTTCVTEEGSLELVHVFNLRMWHVMVVDFL